MCAARCPSRNVTHPGRNPRRPSRHPSHAALAPRPDEPVITRRRVNACSDVDVLLRDADALILTQVDAPVHRAVEHDRVVLEAGAKSSAAVLTA